MSTNHVLPMITMATRSTEGGNHIVILILKAMSLLFCQCGWFLQSIYEHKSPVIYLYVYYYMPITGLDDVNGF